MGGDAKIFRSVYVHPQVQRRRQQPGQQSPQLQSLTVRLVWQGGEVHGHLAKRPGVVEMQVKAVSTIVTLTMPPGRSRGQRRRKYGVAMQRLSDAKQQW